jgi:hypothetical protein
MYDNLQGLGGFVEYYYWSSSQSSSDNAWYQGFNVGYQYRNTKSETYYVRPVRAF